MKIEILNLDENKKPVLLDNEEYDLHIVQIRVGVEKFSVNLNELMSALIAFDAYSSRQNPTPES